MQPKQNWCRRAEVAGILWGPVAHRAGDIGLSGHGVGSLLRVGESCRWEAASPHWLCCDRCFVLQEGERPGSLAVPGWAAAVPRPLTRNAPGPSPVAELSNAPCLLSWGTCPLTAHLPCLTRPRLPESGRAREIWAMTVGMGTENSCWWPHSMAPPNPRSIL